MWSRTWRTDCVLWRLYPPCLNVYEPGHRPHQHNIFTLLCSVEELNLNIYFVVVYCCSSCYSCFHNKNIIFCKQNTILEMFNNDVCMYLPPLSQVSPVPQGERQWRRRQLSIWCVQNRSPVSIWKATWVKVQHRQWWAGGKCQIIHMCLIYKCPQTTWGRISESSNKCLLRQSKEVNTLKYSFPRFWGHSAALLPAEEVNRVHLTSWELTGCWGS